MVNVNSQRKYDAIFADDKLNIKSFVIDFAHLIEQDTYIENGVSKVYSISADFGIGKTFFCEKLKSVLEKVEYLKENPKNPEDFTLKLYPKLY